MRTETEDPPMTFADFKTLGGFLEQGARLSLEELPPPEVIHRGRIASSVNRAVTLVGMLLSSISATTLVLAEIYVHLDGALTGGHMDSMTPLGKGLATGVVLGLILVLSGRFVPGDTRGTSQSADRNYR